MATGALLLATGFLVAVVVAATVCLAVAVGGAGRVSGGSLVLPETGPLILGDDDGLLDSLRLCESTSFNFAELEDGGRDWARTDGAPEPLVLPMV